MSTGYFYEKKSALCLLSLRTLARRQRTNWSFELSSFATPPPPSIVFWPAFKRVHLCSGVKCLNRRLLTCKWRDGPVSNDFTFQKKKGLCKVCPLAIYMRKIGNLSFVPMDFGMAPEYYLIILAELFCHPIFINSRLSRSF